MKTATSRTKSHALRTFTIATATFLAAHAPSTVHAAPPTNDAILAAAKAELPAYLDTLRTIVDIESGSRDIEGLRKLAGVIQDQIRALGGEAELIEPTDIVRMGDTPEKVGPMVKGTFKGRGKSKVMLIGHMDTVYLKGMGKDQPFRVDGDRAYGLGIADDKQGVAMILHAIALMKKLDATDYGTLTVLINGDEEVSSPGSQTTITRLAEDQDMVLSFEAAFKGVGVTQATSGIGAAYLEVTGKASHAGMKPEEGVNALMELSHQLLQLKDLSEPERGLKLNWTVASAGPNRNVIPAKATASADARSLKPDDFRQLEQKIRDRMQNHLLPEAKVDLKFEVRRPPLAVNDATKALAERSKRVYEEIGLTMPLDPTPMGGGTDAAFAGLKTKGAVLESLGATGYGAHSNSAEYIDVPSVPPRLFLVTKLVGLGATAP